MQATQLATSTKRVLKAAAFSLWDSVDAVNSKLAGQRLPPISLRKYVNPLHIFVPTAEEYIAYFKLLGELRMDDTLLDIGCGTGRFAARLLGNPHFFHGTYHGFDPSEKCIEWARANIMRQHDNVHLMRVDLRNDYYHPSGSVDPATFVFPYEAASFDFAFAWSVFTHVMPDVLANYLGQITRVLKPGKRALVTCLLLDGQPESLRKDIIAARRLKGIEAAKWHHRGPYSILHLDQPEKVVAYQRSYFLDAVAQAGLNVVRVCNGSWNHLEDYYAEQDFVVLAKPADAHA